jgi:quercetin dioxygenase-like cupin family protein
MQQMMFFPDWREHVVFSDEGPQPKTLVESSDLKVVLGGLKPGQRIPSHPEGLAVYYFLEGNGRMIVDGEWIPVEAGAVVVTPNGARRGVDAETQLAFVATRIGPKK